MPALAKSLAISAIICYNKVGSFFRRKDDVAQMEQGWTRHDGEQVFYTAPLLDALGAKHFFSTRIGGVSKGCFAGWNFACGVGSQVDDEANVLQNYELAANLFGLQAADVCRSYQTHSDVVLTVGEAQRGVGTVKPKFPFGVDGLVSSTPSLLLSVRSADCVPILFYDPVAKLCGAVHAGWRGTCAGIAANAVKELCKNGSRAQNLYVAIGPCIGPCCYEVGTEVRDAFLHAFPASGEAFRAGKAAGKFLLDLPLANRLRLQQAGVPAAQITCASLCTHCNGEEFFSHRRMGSNRGTMSAFITV